MYQFSGSDTSDVASAFAADHPLESLAWIFDVCRTDDQRRLICDFHSLGGQRLQIILDPTDFSEVVNVPNSSRLSNLVWFIMILCEEHVFNRDVAEFPESATIRVRDQKRCASILDYES